jgi:DNA polymerase-3 subunit gamma/tau
MLTEQVRIPPQIGLYSIYIIDEVHMLSQQAFNAFLKTLEEPPAHAVFILATTEKHKIIPTILSRCQIFDFNRIGVEDAVGYLKSIADKESLGYEEDALHVIAQKADGAMRDALSIFDQVVSFSGDTITYKDVIKNLNILDYEYFFRLTSSALEGDASTMLLLFNEVLGKGFDARNFINGYAAHLRDIMVCKDPATVQLMEVGAGIREKYLSQSQQVPLSFLYEGLDICNQADIQFRASRNQRLTIELALVKLANLTGGQKKKQLTESQAESSEVHPSAVSIPSPDKAERNETPQKPGEESWKSAPIGNGNGISRVVWKPSISIKSSLSQKVDQPKTPGGQTWEGEDELPDEPELLKAGEEPFIPDPDRVLKAWNSYAASIEKIKPRVFSTLQNNLPVVTVDGIVRVLLNTEAQRDNFQKNIKSELLDYIRETTGMPMIDIITEVVEQEQEGKKIYTDQDRLEYMMKKNPELGPLKSRFGLDFDD